MTSASLSLSLNLFKTLPGYSKDPGTLPELLWSLGKNSRRGFWQLLLIMARCTRHSCWPGPMLSALPIPFCFTSSFILCVIGQSLFLAHGKARIQYRKTRLLTSWHVCLSGSVHGSLRSWLHHSLPLWTWALTRVSWFPNVKWRWQYCPEGHRMKIKWKCAKHLDP